MELLVTVCLEWKHLADLACPCLHPRAGESPCGRCVPSCAAACRALHCSAALAGAHHQAGSGGARSRVLCGLGGWARCNMQAVLGSLKPSLKLAVSEHVNSVPPLVGLMRDDISTGIQVCPSRSRLPESCVCSH